MIVSGSSVLNFGGIVSGQVYYVASIDYGSSKITLSSSINGGTLALTTVTAGSTTSATLTSQAEVVQLSTATGTMICNVGLPISPGQINGQQFTFYKTSGEFTNSGSGYSGTNSNLITRDTVATVASSNYLYLNVLSGGTTNIYVNMPFQVAATIGGLSASTTYYVRSIGAVSATVVNTSSTSPTYYLTCDSTTGFYTGMPITFSGGVFGGVEELVIYYVKTVLNSTTFNISEISGGSVLSLSGSSGSMTVTAQNPFITIKDSGGTLVTVSDDVVTTTLTQFPTATPTFFINYVLGGYSVVINTAGSGFAYNNDITILGSSIPGGTNGLNDIIINVSDISSTGEITSTIVSGTPPGSTEQYYLKVISPTELEVYSNPLLTVPVNGNILGAVYKGVKSTIATVATASTDEFTVVDSTVFSLNDPIVFTGTVFGGVTVGATYYVKTKPSSTTITITTTLNGSTFDITSDSAGSMTVAKSGDYVYLPEPFYFDQSIVRYNNRLYQCIVSNNDTEFILGKWEMLDSGDRKLNELDRIVGYYNPSLNMPGRDLTQLVTGITYPGSTYMDNAFPPADEFELDTRLQDQPFYPATIDNISVIWDGEKYIDISTSTTSTALVTSATGNDWALTKLSNNPVSVTDIKFDGTNYVITSSNPATPIYTSTDGLMYTTGPTLTVPSTSLSRSYSYNGVWVAVGENVITSLDTLTWAETFALTNTGYFTDVTYTTDGFTGWLAIGNQTVAGVAQTIIIRSTDDGVTWSIVNAGVTTVITSAYVNSITSGSNIIVIVGNSGAIFTSTNGAETNTQQTSSTANNLVDVTYGNGTFIAVGDSGTIVTSTDGIAWTPRTSGTTNNLNSVAYNSTDSEFIVVGDNNTILTSSNLSTWTTSALFLQEDPVYTVQGDSFSEGYGPEELVPGVVTDNLTMIVTTRPGTNWSVGEYGHTGFTVVSTEIVPTYPQTEYSFLNIVQNPAFVTVYDIDPATGLSRRIYDTYDYTVDWVLKTITLNTTLVPNHILGIELYEVGNGDQLQRSNSQTVPFVDNPDTGFIEMLLNCNYSASRYNGNGIIRPGTEPLNIECIETDALTNSITCVDVSNFALNSPIQFQGAVFGGIAVDTNYFVKTISYVTNKITVALGPLIDGNAGPTFLLTDAIGSMQAVIQTGTGIVWADPLVIHNGTKLILGETGIVTQTKSSTNSIVVNTSVTISVNDPVIFSDTMFGGITPHVPYYVNSIVDANEFTISATAGGSIVTLPDATGISNFITNDYAIAIVSEGQTAKLMFGENYTQENDFITFAVFGETFPTQYSYSVPETQVYLATGGETQLPLINYVGGSNPENAVVELDGLRLVNISDYTIDETAQIIYLNFALVLGEILAITTYNSTDRQYLNTTLGGSYSGSSSVILTISDSIHEPGYDESNYDIGDYSPGPDYLTLASGDTTDLEINSAIIFSSPIGGIVAGVTYYICSILSSTTFTIATTPDGVPITLTTDSGSMLGFINPPRVSNITAINNVISSPLAVTNVSSTTAPNTIAGASTTGFIIGQPIQFKNPAGTTGVGGLLTDGTVYWVSDISGNNFKVSATYAEATAPSPTYVTVATDTGSMIAYVGGNQTVTITTGVPHYLNKNDVVRIDNVLGSVQLNNNTYYVQIISATQLGLYLSEYKPQSFATNDPVTTVSNYAGSGYVWLDKQFTLIDATATETFSVDNSIQLDSLDTIVIDTPIYFSGNTFGNIVEGTRYYVKSLDITTTTITISATYQGSVFVLTDDTGTMGASMWEQTNVDRVWVTVNGYCVPSSSLYLNPNNNLSILTTIVPGDVVIITNVIPTATPDELTYINNVNKFHVPTVYRATSLSTTWLTQPLSYTDSTIYVEDVTKITTNVVQNETVPAAVGGVYTIGLDADKRIISQVIVVNNTTSTTLPSSSYSVQIFDTAPVLEITSGVSFGQSVTVTVILGNLIYVAGEQIKFTTIDFDTNSISGLQRGTNGTGERYYIPAYDKVYGILSTNQLPEINYNLTWNSYVYNTTLGDPLQISDTVAANFLNAEF